MLQEGRWSFFYHLVLTVVFPTLPWLLACPPCPDCCLADLALTVALPILSWLFSCPPCPNGYLAHLSWLLSCPPFPNGCLAHLVLTVVLPTLSWLLSCPPCPDCCLAHLVLTVVLPYRLPYPPWPDSRTDVWPWCLMIIMCVGPFGNSFLSSI
jgi:hypothetical protein